MAKLSHFLFYFIIFGKKFLFNNHYLLKKSIWIWLFIWSPLRWLRKLANISSVIDSHQFKYSTNILFLKKHTTKREFEKKKSNSLVEPGYHYYWQLGSLMQLTCKSPNSKKIEQVECKPSESHRIQRIFRPWFSSRGQAVDGEL